MPAVSIKKPHHTQELSMSCLPACTKMMLNFLGNEIEEPALRNLLATTDDGTAVISMLVLDTLVPDLKVKIHQWSLAHLQKHLETKRHPCIVTVETRHLPYWNGVSCFHAIVIHGFDDKHIFINDPFYKPREFRVTMGEFLLAWSEMQYIAITIERR